MKKNTKVKKIANYIRREVTYSRLKSGEHISEKVISKVLGVSRVPVREAFRILQSEGYLVAIANRGTFVRAITYEYINEMSIMYKLLAPLVLRAAIPKYEKKTYVKAELILYKVENCKDFTKLGYLLWDFAKTIFRPSRMIFILKLFDDIYMDNIRSLNEIFEIKLGKLYDISNHRKFLELCRQNKTEEAIKVWVEQVEKIERISLKGKKSKKM
jgi:DNA-binding GntR family transcriptional regulator